MITCEKEDEISQVCLADSLMGCAKSSEILYLLTPNMTELTKAFVGSTLLSVPIECLNQMKNARRAGMYGGADKQTL